MFPLVAGRSSDQRRADALTLLAERTLSLGAAKTGAQIRPHLSILVREDTWLLLMHRRRITAEGCTTPVRRRGKRSLQAAWRVSRRWPNFSTGRCFPFAALDVLACDAFMQRVILDPTGAPIDLGRTERTYIKDARRAILVRDRHCQWPGCTLRATWCEVHHLTWWSRDGETNQINGITLQKPPPRGSRPKSSCQPNLRRLHLHPPQRPTNRRNHTPPRPDAGATAAALATTSRASTTESWIKRSRT